MIEPVGVTESLMYATARVVAQYPDSNLKSHGTGFFFMAELDDGSGMPIFITNKHVVSGTNRREFLLHGSDSWGDKKPNGKVAIASKPDDWFEHPDPKIDLCCLPMAGAVNGAKPTPFFKYITREIIPSKSELEALNAVEDVLMVGYPNGLWDATNNFPLMRRGITASHPAVDFDVDGVATTVVDMACFPGSSGSPVFIYNGGVVPDKNGNVSIATRIIFLGVLYSGPQMQTDGKIVIKNIPTASVPIPQINLMLNLGYLIKPNEVIALAAAFANSRGQKLKAPV